MLVCSSRRPEWMSVYALLVLLWYVFIRTVVLPRQSCIEYSVILEFLCC